VKRKPISQKVRQEVLEKYSGRCAYCGCELTLKTMQVDHIDPVYKSGADTLENFNPACRSCNFYKGALSLEQFRGVIKSLHERLKKSFIYRSARRFEMVIEMPFKKFFFEVFGKDAK